jgi:hypothetical protein
LPDDMLNKIKELFQKYLDATSNYNISENRSALRKLESDFVF